MTRTFTTLSILLISGISLAQDVVTDNKGETIFSIPTSSFAPKISSKNVGLTFPIKRQTKRNFFVRENNEPEGKKIYTMSKAYVFGGNVSFIDNSKNILTLSDETNITPYLEINYNRTLDEVKAADEKAWFYSTFSVGLFAKYQSFKMYHRGSHQTDRYSRVSPGAKAAVNFFRRKDFAISLSGIYQYAVDMDELTSFQKVDRGTYADGVVISNGKHEGYLGPVKADDLLRLSIGIPFFLPSLQYKLHGSERDAQPVITAYHHALFSDLKQPVHNAGLAFSLVSGSFKRASEASPFKFVDGISANLNLYNSDKAQKDIFVYLTGTFTFGKRSDAGIDAKRVMKQHK